MTDKVKKAHYQLKARVVEKRCNDDICEITLFCPEIAETAKAGQFVMVRCGDENCDDPLLRRPFSIHQVLGENIVLLFKVVGRGTEILSKQRSGETVDIIGPLGKGYLLQDSDVHYLVGGGMGIAPILFLAHSIHQEKPDSAVIVMLGARTEKELAALESFQAIKNVKLTIATDDGTAGHHGLVTDLLEKEIKENGNGCTYCCGPWPMMKAVAGVCRTKDIHCQVSLETMMACGVGACLGCAVAGVKSFNSYLHVCKDGPVFDAREVYA